MGEIMFKKLSLIIFISSTLVFAQEEEVQVIGSLIKGTPIDSGSPVSYTHLTLPTKA